MKTTKVFLQLILMVLLALPVFAQTPKLEKLRNKITDKTQITNLQIEATNNGILLTGTAPLLKEKMKAEKIARDESDGQKVINNIQIQPIQKSDEEINVDVINIIKQKTSDSFVFSNLSVETHNGNVILSGRLLDPFTAKRAAELTAEVPGVQSITNNIQVLPQSPDDDHLRNTLLTRLASDGSVGGYFQGRYPTINIVVSSGHVTLSGIVSSEDARKRAEDIARRTTGVWDVKNEIVVK